jgi:hypothetical protein
MTSARKLLPLVLGAALVGTPVSADQNQASRSPQLPREKVGILQGIFDASLGNLGLIFVNIGFALKTLAETVKNIMKAEDDAQPRTAVDQRP